MPENITTTIHFGNENATETRTVTIPVGELDVPSALGRALALVAHNFHDAHRQALAEVFRSFFATLGIADFTERNAGPPPEGFVAIDDEAVEFLRGLIKKLEQSLELQLKTRASRDN